MTDEEKMLIKAEIYKAFNELPSVCNIDKKFVIAVNVGLERSQKKLLNRKE